MMAVFVAMFISGFWHGAGWTFIIWGVLHGMALVINHNWKKRKVRMPKVLAWLITFNFINLSFVFFRAKGWDDAIKVVKGMFGLSGFIPAEASANFTFMTVFRPEFWKACLAGISGRNENFWLLVGLLVFVLFLRNSNELTAEFRPSWKTFAFAVIICFYSLLNMGKISEFLYFQF